MVVDGRFIPSPSPHNATGAVNTANLRALLTGKYVSQGKEMTQAGKKKQTEGKTQLQLGLQ